MDQGRERKAAAVQTAAVVGAVLAIGAITYSMHERALDADRLHTQVEQLSSFAAEGKLLAEQARQHRLPPVVAREHAAQLAEAFGRAADKLAKAEVQAALAARRDAALDAARIAVAQVQLQAQGGSPGPALESAAKSLSGQVQALENAMP
jgi:hypothetical protein